jgi:hypothetical protein
MVSSACSPEMMTGTTASSSQSVDGGRFHLFALPVQTPQHAPIDLCISRAARIHDIAQRHGIASAGLAWAVARRRRSRHGGEAGLLLRRLQVRVRRGRGTGGVVRRRLRAAGGRYGWEAKVLFGYLAAARTAFCSGVGWLARDGRGKNRRVWVLLRTFSRAF